MKSSGSEADLPSAETRNPRGPASQESGNDTARLDWLEDAIWNHPETGNGIAIFPTTVVHTGERRVTLQGLGDEDGSGLGDELTPIKSNIRAAIDAARSQSPDVPRLHGSGVEPKAESTARTVTIRLGHNENGDLIDMDSSPAQQQPAPAATCGCMVSAQIPDLPCPMHPAPSPAQEQPVAASVDIVQNSHQQTLLPSQKRIMLDYATREAYERAVSHVHGVNKTK